MPRDGERMALNIEELDKKISDTHRQLTELEQLRRLYVKYGGSNNKNGDARRAASKKAAARPASSAPPPNSNGLKAAILGLNLAGRFTVDDIVDALKSKGKIFGRRQVRDSIHVMAKEHHVLRRVEQGVGGKPSTYEKMTP